MVKNDEGLNVCRNRLKIIIIDTSLTMSCHNLSHFRQNKIQGNLSLLHIQHTSLTTPVKSSTHSPELYACPCKVLVSLKFTQQKIYIQALTLCEFNLTVIWLSIIKGTKIREGKKSVLTELTIHCT
jgi:hypothetical protein